MQSLGMGRFTLFLLNDVPETCNQALLTPVQNHMVAEVRHVAKILWPIFEGVVVIVMHLFYACEFAAQHLLHNQAVLRHQATF